MNFAIRHQRSAPENSRYLENGINDIIRQISQTIKDLKIFRKLAPKLNTMLPNLNSQDPHKEPCKTIWTLSALSVETVRL